MPLYQRAFTAINPEISPARTRASGLRFYTEYVEIAKLPEKGLRALQHLRGLLE